MKMIRQKMQKEEEELVRDQLHDNVRRKGLHSLQPSRLQNNAKESNIQNKDDEKEEVE